MFRNLAVALAFCWVAGGSSVSHAASLAGSEWSPSSQASNTSEKQQFIQFQSEGRVSGFAGCNRFFGSYESSGDSLSFGVLGATKMMCPPEAMDQEQTLFENLSRVATYQRDQQRLTLIDKDGITILELVQRDWD
ncbi:MAG: META domain-containing protein [Rhizobiaceae bacterium]